MREQALAKQMQRAQDVGREHHPDMLGFDSLDAYLTRPLTATERATLTPEQKLERRRAQHRAFRARVKARSETLVAYPESFSAHAAIADAVSPTRSSPSRDCLALLDPRRDWIDVRTPG
jgi:hypothetical protein